MTRQFTPDGEATFADLMLEGIGGGEITAAFAQEAAAAVSADHPGTVHNTRVLGSASAKNCLRDIIRWLPDAWADRMPKITMKRITMKRNVYGAAITKAEHPFILPSSWLEVLLKDRNSFHHSVGAPHAIADFWRQHAKDEWVIRHPVVRAAGPDLSAVIPLGIHGDDVKATKRGKLAVLTVNSLTAGSGSTFDTAFSSQHSASPWPCLA